MATGRISKRVVDAMRSAGVAGFLWDEDIKGFGMKVTSSGAASYVLQYRMGGRESKTRRYTIGGHGSPWTPATARAEAERLSLLIAQGTDPTEAEKQRRREAVDLAFDNYADRFAQSCTGKGWITLVKRSFRLHAKPVLGNKPLPQITRADIVAVFDRMPTEQVANKRNVFAVLRRMFRWAVSRGDIERSPMEGMETPPPVKPRDRWLSDEELPRIWKQAPKTHHCFGPIVRLLITTGQRREEVAGLAWEELNRAERMWTLRGERTKNGEPNNVPLNDLAVAVLDGVAGGENWPRRGKVFPTSTGGPFTGYHKGKTKLDQLIENDGGEPIPPWRLHDLRRTLATGCRYGLRSNAVPGIRKSKEANDAVYQFARWRRHQRLGDL